jgi:hypothetical protein
LYEKLKSINFIFLLCFWIQWQKEGLESWIWRVGFRPKAELQWPKIQNSEVLPKGMKETVEFGSF